MRFYPNLVFTRSGEYRAERPILEGKQVELFPPLQVQGEKAVLFSPSLGYSPFIHNRYFESKFGVLCFGYPERKSLVSRLQVRWILGQFSLLGFADVPCGSLSCVHRLCFAPFTWD